MFIAQDIFFIYSISNATEKEYHLPWLFQRRPRQRVARRRLCMEGRREFLIVLLNYFGAFLNCSFSPEYGGPAELLHHGQEGDDEEGLPDLGLPQQAAATAPSCNVGGGIVARSIFSPGTKKTTSCRTRQIVMQKPKNNFLLCSMTSLVFEPFFH